VRFEKIIWIMLLLFTIYTVFVLGETFLVSILLILIIVLRIMIWWYRSERDMESF